MFSSLPCFTARHRHTHLQVMRTELVHVSGDNEYLAKLHCIRLAFFNIFKDSMNSKWISDSGRQILTDLMCLGDKGEREHEQ